jgi:pilus biogenesis lipoprotein CpaD
MKKLSLLLTVFLLGCENPRSDVQNMPEKPYELIHKKNVVTVHFSSHRNTLPADQEAHLLSALKSSKGRGKLSNHITLPKESSRAGKQRLKQVIRILLKAGIKEKQIHKSNALPAANSTSIDMIVDTYHAIPPLCPNWQTQYGPGYSRENTSNFGCSMAHNFLLMLEDPIVLFKAEDVVGRDAARDSLAIADHRAGKDKGKWLRVEKSDSGGSGSMGGS